MITDIAITPDATRLVSIGNETIVLGTETEDPRTMDRRSTKYQARLIVHNLATKDIESYVLFTQIFWCLRLKTHFWCDHNSLDPSSWKAI